MKKMMIPGHFKASTLLLIATVVVAAYLDGEYNYVGYENIYFGLISILLGAFFVDQATHLNQHKHERPPTAIERFMKSNRWFAVAIGEAILVFGVIIL